MSACTHDVMSACTRYVMSACTHDVMSACTRYVMSACTHDVMSACMAFYCSLRQTLGGLQAVYNPVLNTSWIFLKEISSCGCVSTVRVWVDLISCGSGDKNQPFSGAMTTIALTLFSHFSPFRLTLPSLHPPSSCGLTQRSFASCCCPSWIMPTIRHTNMV